MFDTNLESLQRMFPWPTTRPNRKPISWGLDAGGKRLVLEQIRQNRVKVVLEIGVFLGESTRAWLEAAPDLVVLAVDHWQCGDWMQEFGRRKRQPDWVVRQLTACHDSFYETFLANLWDLRDRVIPIRLPSLEALGVLSQHQVKPGLVYLDGDKSGRELEVCHAAFPEAVLTGDDWFMGTDRLWRPDDGYPIRRSVRDYCRRHDAHLLVDRHTWVITDDALRFRHLPTHVRYHLKSLRRRVRGAVRWSMRLD